MNNQARGIKLSLVIHFVVFLAIALLSIYAGKAARRVVIDFSLIKSGPGPVRTVKKDVAKKPVIKKSVTKLKPVVKDSQVEVPKEIMEEEPEPVMDEPEEAIGPVDEVSAPPADEAVARSDIEGEAAAGQGVPGRDFIYIRELVQGNITYPLIARRMGLEGRVVISFVICTNGDVKDIEVIESSGIPVLDKNAVEAVKKTSPFPRHRLEAKVIIPVQYTLQ